MDDKTRAEFEKKIRESDRPEALHLDSAFFGWQAAKELYAPREVELVELLKAAACPENCTNGAYADHYGEPVQCQFCYEREQLIATKEPQ